MVGLASNLKQATIDNLKPRIDIKDLEPGEYDAALILEEISNVDILGGPKIKVVIKDTQDEEDSQTEED